jgi:hypothetical protein
MPWKRELYPDNWNEIAQAVKDAAGWRCVKCGKLCVNPQSKADVLTVHHIDHDPSNCDPLNLVALCAPFHLRADAQHHARNAAITRNAKVRGPMLPLL